MTTNNQGLILRLEGNDGMFKVEKSVILFIEHETTKSIKEKIQHIKREVAKMTKAGEVEINILELKENFIRNDKLRMFINNGWNGCSADIRKFNGYDFSSSEVYNFVDDKNLMKCVVKMLVEYTNSIMGTLPEENTYYSQSIATKNEVI